MTPFLAYVLFLRVFGMPDDSTVVMDRYETLAECRAAASVFVQIVPRAAVLRCALGAT